MRKLLSSKIIIIIIIWGGNIDQNACIFICACHTFLQSTGLKCNVKSSKYKARLLGKFTSSEITELWCSINLIIHHMSYRCTVSNNLRFIHNGKKMIQEMTIIKMKIQLWWKDVLLETSIRLAAKFILVLYFSQSNRTTIYWHSVDFSFKIQD